MTQEELANRADLTKGSISQMENDATSPSIATLEDIAKALGTNLSDFFKEGPAESVVVFGKDDRVISGESEDGFELTFLVPQAHQSEMEPVLVTLEPGCSSLLNGGHEGEEFGYVLSGKIELHLGDKRHCVKKNECFYFVADTDHRLHNPGKRKAEVLWIATPPSF